MLEKPIFRRVSQSTIDLERAEFYAELTKEVAERHLDFKSAERKIEEYHYIEGSLIRIPFSLWKIRRFWRKPENATELKWHNSTCNYPSSTDC